MKAITNATVVLEDGLIYNGSVVIEGESIIKVGLSEDMNLSDCDEIIDAKGDYVIPGFVDIHCHGGNGEFFWKNPAVPAEYFLRHGTTTVLPTLYQDLSLEQYKESIDRIRAVKNEGAGKIIDGVYMEGPFINMQYGSDAANAKWHNRVEYDVMKELVDYIGEDARVWCIAPEIEGAEILAKYLHDNYPNARLSLAHTDSKPTIIRKLKKYGLCNQTHHANATKVINEMYPENWGIREVGPDEACLYDDDMYAELICDNQGVHVKPFMLKMVIKIKGIDKIILITDHYPTAQEGYDLPDFQGKKRCRDLGYDSSGEICGSMITMDQAVRNIMKHTGYGICHAVKFATANPAKMLGIFDKCGSIEEGKLANILIVDDKINIKSVFLKGEPVQ